MAYRRSSSDCLRSSTVVISAVLFPLAARVVAGSQPVAGQPHTTAVCEAISQSVSSASAVYWPGSGEPYLDDIFHYAASSIDNATCSVEPGTAEDVGVILRIVAENRTPFAVKGGGHAMNPHYSSTTGVQIAMTRFNEVNYDANANTAQVGAGLIWDDVYAALEPHAAGAVGGRVSGIGVAGFSLGGGYSWKTNQYGLALDNLSGLELVLANGTILNVSQDSHPDLFWGLKGGFNNFGVVTGLNLTTHPQTAVWGGLLTVIGDQVGAVNAATVQFAQTVTDPKAQVIPSYAYAQGQLVMSLDLFYDSPTPPRGIFDAYLAIPAVQTDLKTRSLLDLVRAAPSNSTQGFRGIYHTVSVLNYTAHVIDAIVNETQFWGERLAGFEGASVAYSVEPFLPTIFSHAPEDSSAYPPDRTIGLSPLSISYAWNDSSADEAMHSAARQSAAQLTRVLISEGQEVEHAALYGNYAIFGTPVEKIYGKHLPRLKALKTQYDPNNVMDLAGGWKF
ncbi:FAD-binding domain-containing protein [Trametes sanguinea]|nr:FAD-binding domain-containing protein [Trametes sanguinea]